MAVNSFVPYFCFRCRLVVCDCGDLVQNRAKRRMLNATLSIAVVCLLSLIFWARGRHEVVVPNENSVRTVTVSFPKPTANFNRFEEAARGW
jgi:hypothetical protein